MNTKSNTMPETTKQEAAKKINEIQQKLIDLYSELEEYKDYDTGGASLSKTLELMVEVSLIRNKILRGNDNGGNEI